jgi:hypothetical protein
MRKKGKLHVLFLVVLSMAVALIGGCQAIGGVDLNKALLSSFDVKSMEGSGSVELEFQFDDKAVEDGADEGELALLRTLNHTKLVLEHVKQENHEQVSVKGALTIGRGSIPFQAYVSPESLVIWPEGAEKPFALAQNNSELLEDKDMAWVGTLQEKAKDPEFLKPLYSYLIGKLPNPKDITVQSGSEKINGETVSLHHVRAELGADEIIPLLRSFIINLMQDDQAMKDVISHYYDTLQPVLSGLIKSLGEDSNQPIVKAVNGILADEPVGLEVLHTEFKQLLVILLVMLDSTQNDANGALSSALGKDSTLAVDLYVDSSLKVRKSGMQLVLAPEAGLMPGVKSLSVKSSFENWNVNGTVKADAIDTKDAVNLEHVGEPADVLKALDQDSVLYKFLKEDLHIGRQTGYFFVISKEEMAEDNAGWAAYNDNGVTMVPARSLSERFGLELQWNEETHTMVLSSTDKSKSVKLQADSSTAVINGKTVELERPPVIQSGALYVPLRAVAEGFGAELKWEPEHSLIGVTIY